MVALAVLGKKLDLMILEGFCNLNDSIILLFFFPRELIVA